MRFKRLYIKDFGIFRNEKLEDLSENIIVIGAKNGSGKTTFMKLLRYLPFGIPKKNTVPPANVEYQLEGDIQNKEGIFNVDLKGYGKPKFTSLRDGQEVERYKVFKDVDFQTYKQLYTISLDELQNNNLNKDEIDSLTTILLGAGYKEIAYLPKAMAKFKKESNAIGGKSGRSTTGKFKLYNSEIKKGIALKRSEGKKLIQYNETKIELSNVNDKYAKIQKDIKEREKVIKKLELLKGVYPLYSSLKELHKEIAELTAKRNQEKNILFEEKKNAIRAIKLNLKSIEERVNIFKNEKIELLRERDDIEKEINYMNSNWSNNFDWIMNVKTDMLEYKRLASLIKEFNELMNEKQSKMSQYNSRLKDKNRLEDEMKAFKKKRNKATIDAKFYISIVILIVGIALSFINIFMGILVVIFSILYSAVYISKHLSEKNNNNYEDIRNKYKEVVNQLEDENEELELINKNIVEIECGLNSFKDKFNIKEDLDHNILLDYFTSIKNIKAKIVLFNKLKEKHILKTENLDNELKIILNMVNNFSEYSYITSDINPNNSIMENNTQIINCFNDLYEDFEEFERLNSEIQSKSDEYVAKDRVLSEYLTSKRALELINREKEEIESNEDRLNLLEQLVSKYFSIRELENEILDEEKYLLEFKNTEKDLLNKQAELNLKLNNLQTTEKLIEAQRSIDKARKELFPIAKEYGVYKASQHIIEKLQLEFLENKRESMLSKASNYFNKITSGKYEGISPLEDLTSLDFKTVKNDGTKVNSSENLSRGLKEQLYLSVRFNRINSIETKLPLIIDDSLVNFDEFSFKNTLEIIKEFSKDHQIFILTCHSYLVEEIAKTIDDAQYFWLEEGRFQETNKKKLEELLKP